MAQPWEQATFFAEHKQWKDVITLTSDGKFWRRKGFRRYEPTSGSAGKWYNLLQFAAVCSAPNHSAEHCRVCGWQGV